MNHTNKSILRTIVCYGAVDRFYELTPEHMYIYYYTLYPIFGTVSFILNVVTSYVIFKTRQLRNQSTRLIFICSINQIGLSVISIPSIVLIFALRDEIANNCAFKTTLIVTSHFFIYSTIYLFSVVAFDRYMRVKHLQSYQIGFNERKFNTTLIIYACLVLIETTLIASVPFFMEKKNHGLATSPLNILVASTTIIFYLVSIKHINQLSANRENVNANNDQRSLTKVATFYLLTYFAFNTPVIVAQLLYKWISLENVPGYVIILYLLPILIGIINTIGFLLKNRPFREMIRTSPLTN